MEETTTCLNMDCGFQTTPKYDICVRCRKNRVEIHTTGKMLDGRKMRIEGFIYMKSEYEKYSVFKKSL